MNPEPFTLSNMRCRWPSPTCEQNVDMRILKQGMYICLEHALLVWSVVDAEIRESSMTNEEVRARQAAEKVAKVAAAEAEAAARRETTKPEPRSNEGYVYYLRVGPHIKIGFARNLERRLASYPPDTELLAVEDGTMQTETERHRTFAALCVAGREWYRPGQILDDHIAKIAENKKHTWWEDGEWKRKTRKTRVKPRYSTFASKP